jgi:anti-anti-sigma factor
MHPPIVLHSAGGPNGAGAARRRRRVIMPRPMGGFLPHRHHARELVLSPQENLVAGGPAEQLEQLIQTSFKQGAERIFVDLRSVPIVDSKGIRAFVRGHTSAERLGRQFFLVAPNQRVREELRLSRLDQVLSVRDSLPQARAKAMPWAQILTALGVTVVGTALVVVGYLLPESGIDPGPSEIPGVASDPSTVWTSPLLEVVKLGFASVFGMLVTVVQRYYRHDRWA